MSVVDPDQDPAGISALDQKLQLLNPSSIKDLKAAGEAFSPQKRTSSTSKDEIY